MPVPSPPAARATPALLVITAGICAALHVGKLAPALPALQQTLGLTLVQAGFALSLVQLAGVTLALVFGGLADTLGARRSMVMGLLLLGLSSGAGGLAQGAAALLAWRALEGLGFLMVVLPAPGLVRRLVPPQRLAATLGMWGGYMPVGTALALLGGPLAIAAAGWRPWWWLLSGLSVAMALTLWRGVPADAPARGDTEDTTVAPAARWGQRVRQTLAAPGPWLVALCFAVYSSQWLAVVGFLPSIYAAAGVAPTTAAPLTALAALVNLLGNLAAGQLGQRGVAPTRVLAIGYLTMALSALAAFGTLEGQGLPPALRYAAVLLFSGVGGLVPATLFALAVRVAPSEHTIAGTVGWMQQWSALGQMLGPPAVAWLAGAAGGWQLTWVATGACSLIGLGLSALMARRLRAGA
jgi:MFS transporter, CP family, cyanate transporter